MTIAPRRRICSCGTHAYVLLLTFAQMFVAGTLARLLRVGRMLPVYMLSFAWAWYRVIVTQHPRSELIGELLLRPVRLGENFPTSTGEIVS